MAVTGRLLAPARDDEERVVDREAEAETGDEIEREDREGVHLDGEPQAEERQRDRAGADERRQERGDEAAEDPEREQEDERERDQLGAAEVALDRLGHLVRGDRAAAEQDPGSSANAAVSRSAASLRDVAAPRPEEGEHDAVLVDDRARDRGIAVDPRPDAGDERRVAARRARARRGRPRRPSSRSTSTFASRLSEERSANCSEPALSRGITVLPKASATGERPPPRRA